MCTIKALDFAEGVRVCKEFFTQYNLVAVPLLLGLSGGPDSMALFHLLLASGASFQVAHIDHRWRPESQKEASLLQALCAQHQLVYHLQVLPSEPDNGNQEEKGRKARLAFFSHLCEQEGLAGVLLAHHADDQAETILKRLFEGASLSKLSGLRPKREIDRLVIYRPLLGFKKNTLLSWLDSRHIPYFDDSTNRETRFLRNRMRLTILPTLSEQFGKEIGANLCRLGESAGELAAFLEESLTPFLEQVTESELSIQLNFNLLLKQPALICKAAIRYLFEKKGVALPRSILDSIVLHLQQHHAHKKLRVGSVSVYIDRGTLTIKNLKS